jgi:hypothetical protein
MSAHNRIAASDGLNRRGFFRAAGAGIGAASLVLAHPGDGDAVAQQWTDKDKLARIASCSYPIRYIFKTRPPAAAAAAGGRGGQANGGMTNAQMKEKYGEITMLDFPQFPG